MPSKWLASSANESITGSIKAAQITNTHGLKLPASRAASDGSPKMPAPMMPLITSSQMPSAVNRRASGSVRSDGAAGVLTDRLDSMGPKGLR